MRERRISTMPPHGLMPRSIPRVRTERRHHPNGIKKGTEVISQRFGEFISPFDVIQADPLLVITELKGARIVGEFALQPTNGADNTLILTAQARIGLNQEGFCTVSAGSDSLSIRVGDVTGPLQKVSSKIPSYNPGRLDVRHNNGLVIIHEKEIPK